MALDLSYQDYGTAHTDQPPLLILHGLFGSAGNWRSIARALSANRRVICLDARNHGDSPHSSVMDYPALSADVVNFSALKDWSQIDVLGHSMGGKTAMVLALSKPTLVRRLLVADIAPVKNEHSFGALVTAMRSLDMEGLSRRSDADEQLKPHIPETDVRQFVLQNLVRDVNTLRWRINIDAIESNMSQILTFDPQWASVPYQGPTLFLKGAKSDYIQSKHAPIIQKYFPNAHIVTIANAGHWLHAENPQVFVEEVNHFLNH